MAVEALGEIRDMKRWFLLLLLMIPSVAGYGQDAAGGNFPRLCRVKAKASLRTGPTTNYESVATLSSGDLLLCRSERYGWFEVDLPLWASVWVHNTLLNFEGPPPEPFVAAEPGAKPDTQDFIRTASIKGDRVNLRSRPGLEHTTIGQADSGTKVRCIARQEEWVKIDAPTGYRGWVCGEDASLLPVEALEEKIRALLADPGPGKVFVSGTLQESSALVNGAGETVVFLSPGSLPEEDKGKPVIGAGRYELSQDPATRGRLTPEACQRVTAE